MERHPIFAAVYDSMMAVFDRLGFRGHREWIGREARGRVLEIGVGTGLNLELYGNADRIVALDPDPDMLRRAVPRARTAGRPVDLLAASAERLPFRDGRFDSIVASLVFCTIPDAAAAANEVRRVLAPRRGRFWFFEHVRSKRPAFGVVQDLITPLWMKLFAGCHPNRETLPVFESAGLSLDTCERHGGVVRGSARAEAKEPAAIGHADSRG